MKRTKKEIEKYYFNKFCKTSGFSPKSFEQKDPPEPDIVAFTDKKIGIEITNFHIKDGKKKSSEQQQAIRRETITQLAQKMFANKSEKKIEISLGFNLISEERNNEQIAEAISSFVIKNQDRPTGNQSYWARQEIPEVNFLWLNSTEYETPVWKNTQVHSVLPLDTTRLAQVIEDKEKKDYQGCDEYWLLIVMDSVDPAQEQEMANTDIPRGLSKKFEKVFLYKTGYEHIISL